MKTRILHTKIYSDSFFVELSPVEKLLFIYYLTNENVNIIGCYECPDRKTSFDTGIDTPKIHQFQEKAEKAGKMFFKDGFVFLKNASKYENYSGERNDTAKETLINQLSIPIRNWYEECIKGVFIPTINHKSEIINHKQGVVKGDWKAQLTEINCSEIAQKYDVPLDFVQSKLDDLENWISEKPTRARGRDLQRTLMAWVKKDKDTPRSGVLKEVVIRPPGVSLIEAMEGGSR